MTSTSDGPSPSPSSDSPTDPTPSATGSDSPAPTTGPPRRPGGTAPAAQDSPIGPWSVALAVLVLAAAGGVLWIVARRGGRPTGRPAAPAVEHATMELPIVRAEPQPGPSDTDGDTNAELRFLVELGEAMIDAGAPVTHAQVLLHEVADHLGIRGAEIIVLPTLLMVSVPGRASVNTAVAAAGTVTLRLDQVDAVYQVVDRAASGEIGPEAGRRRLREIRSSHPPRGPVVRLVGYLLLTLGLVLVLGGGTLDVLVAAGLGLAVGAVQLAAGRFPLTYTVFAPVACAFGVSVAVLLLSRSDSQASVFAALVAPLVSFLPGALLTTSAIELATGQMISGAGRLAAGAMRLVLLAIGIILAAQLVGIPASAVDVPPVDPVLTIAPWIGVAVFGVGVLLHHCARPQSFGWILLVLYVAYAGQVIGGLFVGGVLSAFVGAAVMTPVAMFAARRRNGPPAMVSFMPAFWLLVPGALGLLGVTAFLGAERVEAVGTLVTTMATMIAIALGVLVGLAAAGAATQLRRLLAPR